MCSFVILFRAASLKWSSHALLTLAGPPGLWETSEGSRRSVLVSTHPRPRLSLRILAGGATRRVKKVLKLLFGHV